MALESIETLRILFFVTWHWMLDLWDTLEITKLLRDKASEYMLLTGLFRLDFALRLCLHDPTTDLRVSGTQLATIYFKAELGEEDESVEGVCKDILIWPKP